MLLSNDPPVHDICALILSVLSSLLIEYEILIVGFFPSLDILDQESVNIEPREEHVFNDSLYSFFRELELLSFHDRGVGQVESASVSTILLGHVKWIWVIFKSLGHFLTVFSKADTIDDKVLVWVRVLDGCSNDIKSVEPSSCLIYSLSDEISWESLVKLLIIH